MTRLPPLFIAVLTLAPSLARAGALETVRVPATGAVTLKAILDDGEPYLLKATGTVKVGHDRRDAESGGLDVGLPDAAPWLGPPRPDHTDYMIVNGAGRPLTLRLTAPGGAAGSGALTVSVFRLSPDPAALPKPLETLAVPVLEQTTATALTTRLGAVYLLRCAGQGRVGGGGLGMGDAEYMDYRADGTGREDIGDAHTDYGLGVDEADQGQTPRRNKWGLWRKDHTYSMLFQGTGKPIHFFYYDVRGGYGDNSPTDTLTVRVYALP